MSVSLAVTANHGYSASPASFMPQPGFPPAPANNSEGIAPSGVVMHFNADSQIYAEGDEARHFYKLVEGVARTCRFSSNGSRQIDAFHMTGEVFGFEAGADHRMTAEAVSDCTVIAYRRRGLEALVARNDRLGCWLFSHSMTCLALAREHSLLLGRGTAAQKICVFLREIASRGGSDIVVNLPMSRQDIADYLGLTIETVSRTLSRLERDGAIALPTTRQITLGNRLALHMLDT